MNRGLHGRSTGALRFGLVAAGTVLGALGIRLLLSLGGRLSRPPADPAGWPRWWAERDPLDAVAAVAAVLAAAALAWLVAASSIHLVASVSGSRRMQAATSRLLPRLLATALSTVALGSGPGMAGAAEPLPPFAATPGTDPPTMVVLDPAPPPPRGAPVMEVEPTAEPAAENPSGPPTTVVAESTSPSTSVVVVQGDSLWSIAERRVRLATGSAPEPAEIHPYWEALVEQNRDRLVDRGDPDVLHVGQELQMPG